MLSLYRSTSSRMKYIYVPLLFLSVLFAGLSCQRAEKSYPPAMQRAISLLSARPDSALYYLSQLDSQMADEPEETRMYHALLTLRAEDKLYVRQTSDSLIKSIVIYYNKQGDATKRLEAYYMLGRIYRDLDEPLEALKAFQEAADLGEKTQQYDLLGRVYEQKMYVFSYQNLLAEASEMANKSYDYYCMQKDTIGITYALRNKARLYSKINQKDSMEICYQKAVRIAFNAKDTLTAYSILRELAAILADLHRYDDSEKALAYIPEKSKKENATTLYNIARIYLYRQQEDSAKYYLLKALQAKYNKNIYLQKSIYRQLADLNSSQNNSSAFQYERLAALCSDSIQKINQAESLKKYNYQKAKNENQKLQLENTRKWRLILALTTGGIILMLLLIISCQYIKKIKRDFSRQKEQESRIHQLMQNKQTLLAEKQEKLMSLQQQLKQAESSNKELVLEIQQQKDALELQEQKIRQTINNREIQISELQQLVENGKNTLAENREKINELQHLLQQANLSKQQLIQTLKQQKEIAELQKYKIQQEITEREIQMADLIQSSIVHFFANPGYDFNKRVTEDKWEELRIAINKVSYNFDGRLRQMYPKISKDDLRLCYLVKTNISPKAIAVIFNCSPQSVTSKRTRLYEKIFKKKGNTKDFDGFIADL